MILYELATVCEEFHSESSLYKAHQSSSMVICVSRHESAIHSEDTIRMSLNYRIESVAGDAFVRYLRWTRAEFD